MQEITESNVNIRGLRKFDLNTLLVLHTLLETRSVSQTAARLHVGQPAISHTLKRLRERTSDPLLIRQGRSYLLSAYAESLRQPLTDCLLQAQSLIAAPAPFAPAHASGEFHLAMPDLVELALLPELVRQLQHEAPGLQLRVVAAAPDALEEALAKGRIDATIGHFPRPQPNLVRERLFSARISCFFHPAQLQFSAPLEARAIADHLHVSAHYAGSGSSLIDAWFKQQKLTRHVVVSTGSFLPIATLLSQLPAIAMLPEVVSPLLGDTLSSVPVNDAQLSLDIDLVWHPRNTLAPQHAYLRQKLREAASRWKPAS